MWRSVALLLSGVLGAIIALSAWFGAVYVVGRGLMNWFPDLREDAWGTGRWISICLIFMSFLLSSVVGVAGGSIGAAVARRVLVRNNQTEGVSPPLASE